LCLICGAYILKYTEDLNQSGPAELRRKN
jgi:hypothetical protein